MRDPLDDGGSAFPKPGVLGIGEGGMTLRDYFAAQVAGHVATMRTPEASKLSGDDALRIAAEISYALADALLNVRDGAKA